MKDNPQYRAQSKERLKKLITGKHRTTMIGALDRVENILGFLWGDNKYEYEQPYDHDVGIDVYNIISEIKDILTNEKLSSKQRYNETEIRFKLLFQALRAAILNLGNNNIRDSEKEIDLYDVTWKKYHLNLPVRNPKNG